MAEVDGESCWVRRGGEGRGKVRNEAGEGSWARHPEFLGVPRERPFSVGLSGGLESQVSLNSSSLALKRKCY